MDLRAGHREPRTESRDSIESQCCAQLSGSASGGGEGLFGDFVQAQPALRAREIDLHNNPQGVGTLPSLDGTALTTISPALR